MSRTNTVPSFRPLGNTGLACHCLGFGCYRIHRGHAGHEEALRDYLERGGNLIDTSANYGDGLSEALVGRLLQDYPREKVIIVTKGGYIQGRNMELANRREFPEIVRYGEGIWHCIHPEFLESQITLSLERLGAERVDVYLLHNPEYFLNDRAHFGGPSHADHEEFYRRIREAFGHLESEARRGRIGWYGVSSNNFGSSLSDPARTSVHRCLEEAVAVSVDHHFRVVQLPLNLFEPGGAVEPNCDRRTVLEYCNRNGLGVLVNRPLNAFAGDSLVRLADFAGPGRPRPSPGDLDTMLAPLRASERRLARELEAPLAGGKGIAAILEEIVPQLQTPQDWERAAGPYVLQPLRAWFGQMQAKYGRDMRWQAWADEFGAALQPLLEDVSRLIDAKQQEVSDGVRAKLHRAGYPHRDETLSQMALRVLLNLPGVSSALVGMRRPSYVADCFGCVGKDELPALAILGKFTGA